MPQQDNRGGATTTTNKGDVQKPGGNPQGGPQSDKQSDKQGDKQGGMRQPSRSESGKGDKRSGDQGDGSR